MTAPPGIRCRYIGLKFAVNLVLFLFTDCQGDSGYKSVDFSKTVSVAQLETRQAEDTGLRVEVAAMISPPAGLQGTSFSLPCSPLTLRGLMNPKKWKPVSVRTRNGGSA
jgi:hypothetical protein